MPNGTLPALHDTDTVCDREEREMDLIWHGTAAIEMRCGQGKLLFDPFVPLKHSPVDVKIEEFDGFSDIFITHCHLDHLVNIPEIVKRNPGAMIHGSHTTVETLMKKGVPEKNLTQLHYGDRKTVNGFTVRVFHGKHAVLPKVDAKRAAGWMKSPARGNMPFIVREFQACQENDESLFYLIAADGKTVELMGSMNLRDEVKYPTQADALVLPFNGWEDNYPPAVRIIDQLKPKRVLLDHYDDTFPPVSPVVDVSPLVQRNSGSVTAMKLRNVEHI